MILKKSISALCLLIVWMQPILNRSVVFGKDVKCEKNKNGLITLQLNNEPLVKVIENVEKQTRYKIILDKSLMSYRISGEYSEMKIGKFLRRVLDGKNTAIEYDQANSLIKVKAFGKESSTAHNYKQKNRNEDIEKLSKKANKIYQNDYKNANYIDMSGMTNSQIWQMHKRQDAKYRATLKDPNSSDMSGMTNAEIWKKQRKEDEEFKEHR